MTSHSAPMQPPTLLLGTAMWGWTTSRQTAFALLDEWYRQGVRQVDTATNYPIDKNPDHFRLAEQILLEWITANGVKDLQVMMKVGSVNNLFTPEHILTKSFLLMMYDEYLHAFGENLDTFMVHWDNRAEAETIGESLEALTMIREKGLHIGLSGIKYPLVYAELNKAFQLDFRIQIKHNVLYSDYNRYAPFHGQPRFIAYGINAGGLKLNKERYAAGSTLQARGGNIAEEPAMVKSVRKVIAEANKNPNRPPLTDFYQVGLTYAYYQPDLLGILLGTSSVEQLQKNISFYRELNNSNYKDVFDQLKSLNTTTSNKQ